MQTSFGCIHDNAGTGKFHCNVDIDPPLLSGTDGGRGTFQHVKVPVVPSCIYLDQLAVECSVVRVAQTLAFLNARVALRFACPHTNLVCAAFLAGRRFGSGEAALVEVVVVGSDEAALTTRALLPDAFRGT